MIRRMRRAHASSVLLPALLVAMTLPLGGVASALAALPAGFEDQLVAKVSGPTAIAFTPDGRILVTSHFGKLFVIQGDALVTDPAIDLSALVCADKERGLLGVAVDPAFATNHFIYLYYTFKKFGSCPYSTATVPVNRVSRFVLADSNVIDPATETVLIDNVPNEDGIHNAGDLAFGKDGYLYVSIGDGGCDYAFNSGCGSQNDAARDQHILLGKILRITRSGGIPPGNPFTGGDSARCNVTGMTDPGKKCQETYAWGLRNPFRIAFDPNTSGTKFFINDVGQATWEEIDLGQAGADYGWNVREGFCARGSRTNCGPAPAGMTNPVYAYDHNTGCTGIIGGAFVPNGVWPSAYDNTYLYGDFVCGKIIRLTPIAGGGFTATDFATALGTNGITTLKFGPYGSTQAAYYLNYLNGGEVRRIVYTGTANRAPSAVVTSDKTSGPDPLTVNFDGRTSSDPDTDPLTFEWDFGDGSAHETGSNATHTYSGAGTYTATLTVRDGRGGQGSATVRIDVGNRPPVPVISSPGVTKTFAVGETIVLHGSADDPDEGALANSRLTWMVIKHHDAHEHPFLPVTAGNDIPIVGPDPEDPAATNATYLEIRLTATDAQGLSATVTRNLYPTKVPITFATSPAGLVVGVNGTSVTGSTTITSWDRYPLNVNAADQVDGSGASWRFSGWSDGGAASHAITTGTSAATYTATFTPATTGGPRTLTFGIDADTTVRSDQPTTSSGTNPTMIVDNQPVNHTLVRFTVSGVGTDIVTGATLRMYVTNSSPVAGTAYRVASQSWPESVTWRDAPVADLTPITTGGKATLNTWVAFDLSPLITADGTYSVRITSTSADGARYASRETTTASLRPQVEVKTSSRNLGHVDVPAGGGCDGPSAEPDDQLRHGHPVRGGQQPDQAVPDPVPGLGRGYAHRDQRQTPAFVRRQLTERRDIHASALQRLGGERRHMEHGAGRRRNGGNARQGRFGHELLRRPDIDDPWRRRLHTPARDDERGWGRLRFERGRRGLAAATHPDDIDVVP